MDTTMEGSEYKDKNKAINHQISRGLHYSLRRSFLTGANYTDGDKPRKEIEMEHATYSTASTPKECSWMSNAPSTVSRWDRFLASSSPLLLINSHS